MKKRFPVYRKKGTHHIEKSLSQEDKEVLKDFLTFAGSTANDYKVQCRKSELLQMRDIIEKPFGEWHSQDIIGFLNVLKQDSRKTWTKKCIAITLQMFIKWKWKDWSERFDNLDILKKFNKSLKPNNQDIYNDNTMPTDEEIDAMIRASPNVRGKLWISMAREAGLPLKVQRELKWKDIKIDNPQEGISVITYFRAKNRDSFVFPLKVSTYYLKQWKQEFCFSNVREEDFIFASPKDRERPLTDGAIYHLWKQVAKLTKYKKRIYQYMVRHKTLSEAYAKLPEEIHRKLFGHVKGSRQTATYSNKDLTDTAVLSALEKLHKVEQLTKEQQNKYDKKIEELERALKKRPSKEELEKAFKENWDKMIKEFAPMAREELKQYARKPRGKR